MACIPAYVAAHSLQLFNLLDLARKVITQLGDDLSLLSLISAVEESKLWPNAFPAIGTYIESRVISPEEDMTCSASKKAIGGVGTLKILDVVLFKAILLFRASEEPRKK